MRARGIDDSFFTTIRPDRNPPVNVLNHKFLEESPPPELLADCVLRINQAPPAIGCFAQNFHSLKLFRWKLQE